MFLGSIQHCSGLVLQNHFWQSLGNQVGMQGQVLNPGLHTQKHVLQCFENTLHLTSNSQLFIFPSNFLTNTMAMLQNQTERNLCIVTEIKVIHMWCPFSGHWILCLLDSCYCCLIVCYCCLGSIATTLFIILM